MQGKQVVLEVRLHLVPLVCSLYSAFYPQSVFYPQSAFRLRPFAGITGLKHYHLKCIKPLERLSERSVRAVKEESKRPFKSLKGLKQRCTSNSTLSKTGLKLQTKEDSDCVCP